MKTKTIPTLLVLAAPFAASAAPTVSYVAATNIAEYVSGQSVTNLVTKEFVEDLGISAGGADTNAVNDLIRSYDATNLTARINAKVDRANAVVSNTVKIVSDFSTETILSYGETEGSQTAVIQGNMTGFTFCGTVARAAKADEADSLSFTPEYATESGSVRGDSSRIATTGHKMTCDEWPSGSWKGRWGDHYNNTFSPFAMQNEVGTTATNVVNYIIESSNLCTVSEAQAMTNGVKEYADNKFLGYNKLNFVEDNFGILSANADFIIENIGPDNFKFRGPSTSLNDDGSIYKYKNNWNLTDGNHANAQAIASINDISSMSITNGGAKAYFDSNADYALTNLTGAAVSLMSGEIGNASMTSDIAVTLDFSQAVNRSGDCLLYLVNATAADHDIVPTQTNGYTFVSTDLAKALTIGKATTNIVMFSRLKSDTIMVSKQEIK